jgi:hypothetical protein
VNVPARADPPKVHDPPVITKETNLFGCETVADTGRAERRGVAFRTVILGTDVETAEYTEVSVGTNIADTSIYVPALKTVLDIEVLILNIPGTAVPPKRADPPERDTLPIVAGYVIETGTVGRTAMIGCGLDGGWGSTKASIVY